VGIWVGKPSGVPGGYPNAGMVENSPAITKPVPDTAIAAGTPVAPTPPRSTRRTPAANAIRRMPATRNVATWTQPPSPRLR
jgi:hypothetical protein